MPMMSNSTSGSHTALERPSYKKTDFRYQLWLKDRKSTREKAKRNSFRVTAGKSRCGKGSIAVDTSHARSTVDVLRMCLKDLGWREYPFGRKDGGDCDIYWHGINFGENPDIQSGRVNKFPGMIEVVRKVNLGRALDTLYSLFPQEFDFHPQSWFLPQQFAEFCDAARRLQEDKDQKTVFIVKPDEGSQGDGIYIIQEPREYLFNNGKHIVQTYIHNPMLLEGLKFDFRIYVVVASLEPLEVYVCHEGLARFCTVPYQFPTNKNLHEAYMHLTNYSLNKRSAGYLHTESDMDGSKRTVSSVLRSLRERGHDVERIWCQIEMVVAKTMIAIAPELKVEYRAQLSRGGPSCFQILGFDILLTDTGQPMLLEVNANPSLRIDFEQEVAPGIHEYIHSPVDEEIKRPLVLDTLILAAPRHKTLKKRPRIRRKLQTRSQSTNILPIRSMELARTMKELSVSDNEENISDDSEDDDLYEACPRPHTGYGSLIQVYPRKYGTDFEWLTVLNRAAEIFLNCLGVRGSLRMGSTGFRTFTRKCNLVNPACGLTNASFDIMFIDLQRRWDHSNDKGASGLCFQGFLEAFFSLACKRFPSESSLDAIEKLLDFSESSFTSNITKSPMFPQISKSDKKIEDLKQAYGMSNRKRIGNSYYLDYKNFASESRKGKPPHSAKLKALKKKAMLKGSSGEQSDDE